MIRRPLRSTLFPDTALVRSPTGASTGLRGGPPSERPSLGPGYLIHSVPASAGWLFGEYLELPQRVSVRGGAGGAVHPDIPRAAGNGECLRAARSRSGGVDRGPG